MTAQEKPPRPNSANDELSRENAELREALEESRHAQQKLRDAEQRLRAVIENTPVIVFATDSNGIFTLSEGRGLEALGLAPGQVVGMSAFEVYRDFPQICENLHDCLAGNMVNSVTNVHDQVFEVLYAPRRNDDGDVTGVSGVAWDVTARVRAEEMARDLEAQLRQSQKMEMVGTLAGGIAHDFNNILSPILGFSDLALADLPKGHRARDDIEQVMLAARRARDLVEQILIFSRRGDQTRRPVQLHLVVNEALKLIRSSLPGNIEISQSIQVRDDTVLANPGQMHQIVMNLAVNAVHAMRENGGVMRVELGRQDLDEVGARSVQGLEPGAYVVLCVTDQGEGMDSATRARVFEPFFTTKRPGEGTGLGLSVVHGIVHSLGGGIEVKSNLGEGATFRVYLPLAPAATTEMETPAPEPGRGGEHILIVDDEPAIVTLLQRMLESRGYRVTGFSSPDEALAMFRRSPASFDAVITDQTMPRMNGLELAGAIHVIRPGLPVLLTTGYVDRAAHRDFGRDITGVIPKPYDAVTIAAVVRRTLDAR